MPTPAGTRISEAHKFLASAGVDFMQGYLLGRAMSKDDLAARVSREREAAKAS